MLHGAQLPRFNLLGALVFCLVLSGCFSMGRDFGAAPVRQIQNNVTTQREVFAYFGEPIRKGLENGLETWTYSYQYYELGQLRDSKELHVVFNKDLTVKSYSFTAR
jgi:hypothetical protein